MVRKFLRRTWRRYSKLGKKRPKKQKWRRPTGRDNKMREKRKGYPAVVSIGYKKENTKRYKINGKNPIYIRNLEDLNKVEKNSICIIGKMGKRKKIEVLKKAKEKNIEIVNKKENKILDKNLGENKK